MGQIYLLDNPLLGEPLNLEHYANGGILLRDLELPDFQSYAVDVPAAARTFSEPTRVLRSALLLATWWTADALERESCFARGARRVR